MKLVPMNVTSLPQLRSSGPLTGMLVVTCAAGKAT